MQPTGPTDPADPRDTTERLDTVDSADAEPTRASWWRPVVTAGVAVVALVAAAAFGAAVAGGDDSPSSLPAAASSSSDENSGDEPRDRMDRFREWAEEHGPGMLRERGHMFGPGFGHGLLGGALHGSYVAPAPDGGYRTVVVQRGEVTEVADTSLTVVSEDDFSTTYRIDEDTLVLGGSGGVGGIEVGDEVGVTGVRTDGEVRAVHVTDLGAFSRLFDERRGPNPNPSGTVDETAADV